MSCSVIAGNKACKSSRKSQLALLSGSCQLRPAFLYMNSSIVLMMRIVSSLSSGACHVARLFHKALLRLFVKSDGASLPCLIAFICSMRASIFSFAVALRAFSSSRSACNLSLKSLYSSASPLFQSVFTRRALPSIASAAPLALPPASWMAFSVASSVSVESLMRSRNEKSADDGMKVSASSALMCWSRS